MFRLAGRRKPVTPTARDMDKKPFSLTVDLNFLYHSEEHGRIFEEIREAVRRRDGLVCLTGEPGTGKTVICRRILDELGKNYNVVLVNTPPRTPDDMTQTLDEAFGEMESEPKVPVAIFDEAQHLDLRCMDHVKFLTNLEKDGGKLLQIILVGQPELEEKLSHKRLVQLEQRIGAKLRLGCLQKKEVLPYLTHRLAVAKLSEGLRFTWPSARYLYKKTLGVPRLINRIANIAVEEALHNGKKRLGVRLVSRAVSRVSASRADWESDKASPRLSKSLYILLFLFVLSAGTGLFLYMNPDWHLPLVRDRVAETRPEATPLRYALTLGNYLKREEAEALRDQLTAAGFSSALMTKNLGDGWILYQVRLRGVYSQAGAEKEMEMLRSKGLHGGDRIQVSPAPER